MDPIIAIIKQYYPLLLRYARRIVIDKFAAEDIAMYVLEQAWQYPGLWNDKASLRSHLQSATRIQSHNWLLQQALQIRKQKPTTGNQKLKTSNKPPSNK